jgi:hypothetical protein
MTSPMPASSRMVGICPRTTAPVIVANAGSRASISANVDLGSLAMVHAPAIDQLEAILDRFLVYGNTTTSIVVSTPVPRRPPPLPLA